MEKKIKNYDEYVENTEKGARFFNEQNYSEALKIFQELAKYNNSNYKVFETLTKIYLKINDIPSAEESYLKAKSLLFGKSEINFEIRTFADIIADLDDIETLETNYSEQIKAFDKDTSEAKNSPELHKLPIMMGMRYMALGDFKKAEEMLVSHKNKYFS